MRDCLFYHTQPKQGDGCWTNVLLILVLSVLHSEDTYSTFTSILLLGT